MTGVRYGCRRFLLGELVPVATEVCTNDRADLKVTRGDRRGGDCTGGGARADLRNVPGRSECCVTKTSGMAWYSSAPIRLTALGSFGDGAMRCFMRVWPQSSQANLPLKCWQPQPNSLHVVYAMHTPHIRRACRRQGTNCSCA